MNIQINIPVFSVYSRLLSVIINSGNNSLQQNPLSRDTIKCTYTRQIYNPSLTHLFFRSLFDTLILRAMFKQLTFLFKKSNQYEKNYGSISRSVEYIQIVFD